MRVEDTITATGYFWLPDDEQNYLPGQLSIRDGGQAQLELWGTFNTGEADVERNHARIVGVVSHLGSVTLEELSAAPFPEFESTFQTHISEPDIKTGSTLRKMHFTSNLVICGARYAKDIVFDSVSFSFDGLDDWVVLSRHIDTDYDFDNRMMASTYNLPEPVVLYQSSELEIILEYTGHASSNIKASLHKIEPSCAIVIKAETEQELPYFVDIMAKLTFFFRILSGVDTATKSLAGYSNRVADKYDDKIHPRALLIYFPTEPYLMNLQDTTMRDMFLTLPDVEEGIEGIIRCWFDVYSEAGASAETLYDKRWSKGPVKHLKEVCSALEGLHSYDSRFTNMTYMKPKEYEAMEAMLISSHPEGQANKWLKKQLKYGNKITLQQVILEISASCHVRPWCIDKETKISEILAQSRNYYTHSSGSKNEKVKEFDNAQARWVKLAEFIWYLSVVSRLGLSDLQLEKFATNFLNHYDGVKELLDQI